MPKREDVPERISEIVLPASGKSQLESQLIQAFLESEYRVKILRDNSIVLKVGERNSYLIALHERCNVSSSAFITAWNPRSQITDAHINAQLNKTLRDYLFLEGLEVWPGIGIHPSGSWEGEKSFLVSGMTLIDAIECGNKYDQNAIVWVGTGGTPQLVLLK